MTSKHLSRGTTKEGKHYKDRLKFRAKFSETYSYSNENEEEKTVEFRINRVGICENGDVTFSQDALKEALEGKGLSEANIEEIVDQMQANNSNSADSDYFVYEFFDCIEQCLGIKDCEGKMMFEKDEGYIGDEKYVVKYDEKQCCFILDSEKTTERYLTKSTVDNYSFKVSSNTHGIADGKEGE